VAERFRDEFIARAEGIARGDINPEAERLVAEAKKPIRAHKEDYVYHCRITGQDPKSVKEKERHLNWFLQVCESTDPVWRLDGIRADVVDERLGAMTADGLSARTVNIHLASVRSFVRWCVARGRLERDPLKVLKPRNEVTDRRLVHRVLSPLETERLLHVAQDADGGGKPLRWLWYAMPLYMGLRRGDLERLNWADLDLEARTLTIRGGKARYRVDVLPIPMAVVEELQLARPATALPSARVFARPVSNPTRKKDYMRAGIVLLNDKGTATLHSLRATFATRLASNNVGPAVLQKLMRHCTPTLTMKYYVHLEVDALRAATEGVAPKGAGRLEEIA